MALIIFLALLVVASAFKVPPRHLVGTLAKNRLNAIDPSVLESASTLVPAFLRKVDPSEARGAFFFFFFAGSGALGIGGAQIPKLLAEFDEVKQLAGSFSKGGKEYPLSPIASFGYPEPVYEEDLNDVLNNMPTIKEIQEAGDKKSFMAAAGYLERDAFNKLITERAGGNINKVALQCVFDALTGGGSTTLAPPQVFAEKMPLWKTEGLESLAADLQTAQGKRLSAFAFFAFLLFVVFDLIIESGVNGWAPQYFPGSF